MRFIAVCCFVALACLANAELPAQSPAKVSESTTPQMPPVTLRLIRDRTVWEELGLSPTQIDQVDQLLGTVDGPWWRSRLLPADEQAAQIRQLTEQADRQLANILTPQQHQRFEQLVRQALGTRMALLPDVATALNISPDQSQKFRDVAVAADQQIADLHRRKSEGEDPAVLDKELQQVREREQEKVVALLSATQRQGIGKLVGEPFSLEQIKRTLPKAPELVDEQAIWLQGEPNSRRLESLRGKVVAVHFYAFQCINCKRNLPHYTAWFDDYADQGLVVIGIQTPETSAERIPERVRSAMQTEDIAYPVLMDTESNNWKRWGNTMWPTVYLVDKEGFIRTWWQGELNWQGTPGEQRMRKQIESLLAEPAPSRY